MRNRLRSASRDSNTGNNAMNHMDLRVSYISSDLQPRDVYQTLTEFYACPLRSLFTVEPTYSWFAVNV